MKVGERIHGFEILSVGDLPEMNAVGIFARHEATGCEVYHILNDDEENLFAYAFMTPPEDSTGVAHILEHSVLCGSKNYPLKDPFMVLAKQSVKTFLNAMTFPDKTVYPASSMVEADYFNLMSVYGDAVFFPLLEEWTFRQEGHRFEIDGDGHVSVQGVVFNEMRGNYSSFDSIAGDWSLRSLLEGTPYAHDSGGDPSDIPALSYEQFKAFHAKYYHPVNCRVFLAGNIPTDRQLALLNDRFLSHFGGAAKPSPVEPVSPFAEPRSMEVPAPTGEDKDLSGCTVLLNWLLPEATDTIALMEANLVTEILMGHDGAPLSRALLESGLGEDIAPSSGLETEIRHLCFCAGLRGVSRARAGEVERLVLRVVGELVSSGIDEDEIATAVRSIDFSNREVRRSGGPFSLSLMRRSLRGWIHGFRPDSTLRYIPAFEEVKRRLASEPGYVRRLLTEWFLENPHRSLVTVYPDPEYEKRLDEQLATRVRLFEATLDDAGRAEFIKGQEAFFARQKEVDSPEILARIPHLGRNDLPVAVDRIASSIRFSGDVPLILHDQPTNGIAYADFAIPVDILPADDYPLLPFFSSILTGMGLDGLSWVEASALSARQTGGLGTMLFASSTVPGTVMEAPLPQSACGRDYLIVRVKLLEELCDEAVDLVFRFLAKADFSDTKRLSDLLLEYRNDLDSSLAPSGNQYAVSRAAWESGRTKTVDEVWNGLAQLHYVRALSARVGNADRDGGSRGLEELSARLTAMRERLLGAGLIVNLTGTEGILERLVARVSAHAASFTAPVPAASENLEGLRALARGDVGEGTSLELVSASLQVGFASACLPSPPYGSADHAVDIVFGQWLANGPLWESVRTAGGAYGVFSYPDSLEDIFVFSSYRDPSPLRTLEVFRGALEFASGISIDPVSLEKTITGCYSREVQPRSPSDKGFTAFIRILYGITDAHRKAKIERIISVSPEDMRRVARRMLDDWPKVRAAVVAGKKQLKDAGKTFFSGNVTGYKV